MRVRFTRGAPGDVCQVFGRAFPLGEWVDIGDLDPALRETLAANPTFAVEAAAEDPATAIGATLDQLRAELAGLGIDYHPRAGPAKLAAQLQAARAAQG